MGGILGGAQIGVQRALTGPQKTFSDAVQEQIMGNRPRSAEEAAQDTGPSHLLQLCPGDELDVGAGDLGEVLQRPPVRAAELFFRPVRNFYARSGVFLRLGDILCVVPSRARRRSCRA